ncbi:MAG: hypothetical protein AB4042_16255 [Leptolyngbyaceae cyanobacterium]
MKRASSFLPIVGVGSLLLSSIGMILPQSVQAQSFSSMNAGLFHPRSSEQFFQDGLEQFETEVACLVDTERCGFTSKDLLVVDETVPAIEDELMLPEEWRQEPFHLP